MICLTSVFTQPIGSVSLTCRENTARLRAVTVSAHDNCCQFSVFKCAESRTAVNCCVLRSSSDLTAVILMVD